MGVLQEADVLLLYWPQIGLDASVERGDLDRRLLF